MTDDAGEAVKVVRVCVNRRLRSDQPSCAANGSEALADALEAGIAGRCLDVRLERSVCMGHCTKGPNVRFVPGGPFRFGCGPGDVEALLDALETARRRSADDGPPLHLLGS